MTMGFDKWLGCSGRGRASNVLFFFVRAFIGAMVVLCGEFGRMEGLQVTSNVIDSWERIAVGSSFHWVYAQHNTQHPQMMCQNMNE